MQVRKRLKSSRSRYTLDLSLIEQSIEAQSIPRAWPISLAPLYTGRPGID